MGSSGNAAGAAADADGAGASVAGASVGADAAGADAGGADAGGAAPAGIGGATGVTPVGAASSGVPDGLTTSDEAPAASRRRRRNATPPAPNSVSTMMPTTAQKLTIARSASTSTIQKAPDTTQRDRR